MEHVGAFFDEEWESLSKLFSSTETADFMLQLHGVDNVGSSYGTDHPQLADDQYEANNNFHYFSQESSITSCGSDHGMFFTNNPSHEHLQHFNNIDDVNNQLLQVAINNHHDDQFTDFFVDRKNLENMSINPAFPNDMAYKEEMVCDQLDNAGISPVSDKEMPLKRKCDKIAPENPKRKSRGSQDAHKITKKKAQPKKGKKTRKMTEINNEGDKEETNNADNQIGQSSSCCSYENDSNASQELNGDTISSNPKGKSRASRGAATDPQSLYARKRRERINERLRILQNLVPNGTKVDISTMLEEAVTYVKFLQLQIKLLSSDELWMYAPLAYHGMDIGIYEKMLPSLQ
ncbi:hypothetical protein RND71_027701 [Anisodus tanguticus]|uniref:BHLH domain-containing protein n=1 Tax=Anisodus tanguticus TaxID=243964 RepID=A0AAE1RID1_9SOLA|nr:hypothetical protein RND71_027701 [Anisodus tanguticus]